MTALLRLSFPDVAEADSDPVSSTSTRVPKHPTELVTYLLKRSLVADSHVPAGVSKALARAGDWVSCTPSYCLFQLLIILH